MIMDSFLSITLSCYFLLHLFGASMELFARGRAMYDNAYISPDHVVLSAAVCKASCYYRCIQKYTNSTKEDGQMQGDSTVPETSTNLIEEKCKKHEAAFISSCTSSCEFAGDAGSILVKCYSQCQEKDFYCKEGCEFLAKAVKTSLGSCPETFEVDKVIDRECHLDQQCISEGDVRKCCSLRCVVPKFHSNIGPSLWPPTIMEGKDGSSFEMTWKYDDSLFGDNMLPILFVLQVRTQFNKDFESTKASNWKTLLITFRVGVHLQDLQPGMWYQFRVASVTKYGTRGFKSISPPVRLSRIPKEPGSPRNLTDGAWRIKSNGNINIQIHWVEPAISDIAISEYKISWVRDHGFIQPDGQSLEALTDFVQTVPGTQKNYDIEALLPDKTYKVQVRAVCKWGSAILVSRPNTIFLTTPALPAREAERIVSKDSTLADEVCMCPKSAQDPRIFIGFTHLKKNLLNADLQILNFKGKTGYKITYTPRVCIDSELSPIPINPEQPPIREIADIYREKTLSTSQPNVTLSPLQFSCRYNVQVQTMKTRSPQDWNRDESDLEDDPDIMSTCFCTPSCLTLISEYKKSDSTNLRCLNKVTPTLLPPTKLFFQRSQKNPQSFLVFWSHPYVKNIEGQSILNIRYRVIWGPSIDDHIDTDLLSSQDVLLLMPRVDMSQAETKVLKENVSSIWLENLRRNQYYVVQVQALLFQQGVEQISPKQMLVLSTYKDPSHQKLSLNVNSFNHATSHAHLSHLVLTFLILHYHFRS